MDAQAPWYRRMFPWPFRATEEPVPIPEEDDKTGQYYYEIWFDGTEGDDRWWFAIYSPEGERLSSDWHYGERYTHRRAKEVVNGYKHAAKNKARGKTEPERFYA